MSDRFEVLEMPLEGLKLIQRKLLGDSRGYLERLFCTEELRTIISGKDIVQINHTLTAKRCTVRGMHFQNPPHAETKFISCLRGEVFDVALDLRRGSTTFLLWHAEILSAENHKTMMIPEGFARGFQTLTEDCEMIYLHTANYNAESESGFHVQDPRLAIKWPLSVAELSVRDRAFPLIGQDFRGLSI